jgi:alpha/beta superfamily hydrolase
VPRSTGSSRLIPVTIPGPAGGLEGLLQIDEGVEYQTAALVCHPHPLYGGTMHNKVVHRTAAALAELKVAVLRFNFRGVGKSVGSHDQGRGELEDARGALQFLRDSFPSARRWVAGFSFGAGIAARLADQEKDVDQLILIAPSVDRSDFDVLRTASVPKLVVQGTRDDVCPLAALEKTFAGWAEPKAMVRIEGATHFFDRQLGELSKALVQALRGPASGGTSETT